MRPFFLLLGSLRQAWAASVVSLRDVSPRLPVDVGSLDRESKDRVEHPAAMSAKAMSAAVERADAILPSPETDAVRSCRLELGGTLLCLIDVLHRPAASKQPAEILQKLIRIGYSHPRTCGRIHVKCWGK